jgi:hypothetical protein
MTSLIIKPMTFGPRITTPSPLLSGEVGFAYATALNGTGGSSPYTYVVVTGALPAGLSMNSFGIIAGTPTTVGSPSFGIQITDAKGAKGNVTTFGLTVVAMVAITTSSLPNAQQGVAYSTTLAASGGVTPYSWSLVAGSIDPGLSLNPSSGNISGTPTTPATYTPTFQVTDALGYEVQKQLNLTVGGMAQAATPTFSPAAGTYTSAQTVTISCSTPSPTIYYTTNGTTPTTSSPVYSSPISVSSTQTVQAIATAPGYTQSNVGSAAYTISTSSQALTKFRSGMYMMSGNPNDQASMNALATSWAGNGGKIQGYSAWYKWSNIETALGTYNFTSVFNDYTYLQSVAPGASFIPQFNWYANQTLASSALPTFNPNGDGVPSYICDNPATYGAGPPTSSSSYGGWCADTYISPNYNYVNAAFWRTAVQARIEALFQAFGSTIVPDGQGFTVDQHPLFEMVGTSTPTDFNMQTAPNIPADYTYELANQAWLNMLPSLRATMPHTEVFLMPGFGANNFSGGNDPTQQNVLIKAMLANGIAQSCTDVYTPTQLTYAQYYLIGSNYNGTAGFQTPLLGQIDSVPSVQGDDYPLNSITEILNCSFVTLQASRVLLYSQSSANFNIPGFWNTIIGTINSYSIPAICGELPVMIMAAPTGLTLTSFSGTTASLSWTAQTTNTGTGLTYTVFRNGVNLNLTLPLASPSYTDTASAVGDVYTVAVTNQNGTGPQSSSVSATTAVNPIWVNLAAGGVSLLSYENFAIFKNRVREGRMTSGSFSATTGWPMTAFTFLLWEGNTLPSWATAATSSTPFKCGYIGTGTPSSYAGCTVANIVTGNGTTTYTTFDLYNCTATFGFSSTAAATNLFAYLPEYPAETIDNPTTAAAFRTEAINFYKQFAGIRFMWWSCVTQNTGENTLATRNTSSNTQFYKNWAGNASQGVVAEGYPVEWAAAFCAACNIGIYYNLPVYEDGTQNAAGTYTNAVLGVLNSVIGPTGKPIRLEIGNELVWNGNYPIGTTLQNLGVTNGFPNTADGAFQYLGYKLHALANACRTVFGSAFNSQVKLIFASQTGGNGWGNFFPAALSYMQTNYGTPGNDVKILSTAPYMNLANNAGDTSVALVLSDLSTVGAVQPYNSNAEHVSILAQHYGMELAAYEAGWQTNSEASGNAYISSAIMNSGMVGTMETYWNALLNAGYIEIAAFESGASSGEGTYPPTDEFTTSDANIQTAPRVTALLNFTNGSYTQTRNAIGPGGVITGGNFADSINGASATLTNFTSPVGNYSAACQFYWTGSASTRSLVLNVTGSGTTNIEMGGTVLFTSVSLVSGNNTFSVPVQAGWNYLLIGNGNYQNVTINSAAFN